MFRHYAQICDNVCNIINILSTCFDKHLNGFQYSHAYFYIQYYMFSKMLYNCVARRLKKYNERLFIFENIIFTL